MLVEHVERFNEAVRSGDDSPMLAAFAPTRRWRSRASPSARSCGRDAIAAAYAQQPPDDEIVAARGAARERRHGGDGLRVEGRAERAPAG